MSEAPDLEIRTEVTITKTGFDYFGAVTSALIAQDMAGGPGPEICQTCGYGPCQCPGEDYSRVIAVWSDPGAALTGG
jgi:hypothetical protein